MKEQEIDESLFVDEPPVIDDSLFVDAPPVSAPQKASPESVEPLEQAIKDFKVDPVEPARSKMEASELVHEYARRTGWTPYTATSDQNFSVKEMQSLQEALKGEDVPDEPGFWERAFSKLSFASSPQALEAQKKAWGTMETAEKERKERVRKQEFLEELELGHRVSMGLSGGEEPDKVQILPLKPSEEFEAVAKLVQHHGIDPETAHYVAKVQEQSIKDRIELRINMNRPGHAEWLNYAKYLSLSTAFLPDFVPEDGIPNIGEAFWTPYDAVMGAFLSSSRGLAQWQAVQAGTFLHADPGKYQNFIDRMGEATLEERRIFASQEAMKEEQAKYYGPKDKVVEEVSNLATLMSRNCASMAVNLYAMKKITGLLPGEATQTGTWGQATIATGKQVVKGAVAKSMLTPGGLDDRGRAAAVYSLYISTPITSSFLGGLIYAGGVSYGTSTAASIFIDTLTNMALTDSIGEGYYEMAQAGFDRAVSEGRPDLGWLYAVQNVAPDLMGDVFFSMNTRPSMVGRDISEVRRVATNRKQAEKTANRVKDNIKADKNVSFMDGMIAKTYDAVKGDDGKVDSQQLSRAIENKLGMTESGAEAIDKILDNYRMGLGEKIYKLGDYVFEADNNRDYPSVDDMFKEGAFTGVEKMGIALQRVANGDIGVATFQRALSEYLAETNDQGMTRNIAHMTRCPADAITVEGLDRLSSEFAKQRDMAATPDKGNLDEIARIVANGENFSFTTYDTKQGNVAVKPDSFLAKELFSMMRNIATGKSYGGQYVPAKEGGYMGAHFLFKDAATAEKFAETALDMYKMHYVRANGEELLGKVKDWYNDISPSERRYGIPRQIREYFEKKADVVKTVEVKNPMLDMWDAQLKNAVGDLPTWKLFQRYAGAQVPVNVHGKGKTKQVMGYVNPNAKTVQIQKPVDDAQIEKLIAEGERTGTDLYMWSDTKGNREYLAVDIKAFMTEKGLESIWRRKRTQQARIDANAEAVRQAMIKSASAEPKVEVKGEIITEKDGSQYEVVGIRQDGSKKRRQIKTKRWSDDYGKTWKDGHKRGDAVKSLDELSAEYFIEGQEKGREPSGYRITDILAGKLNLEPIYSEPKQLALAEEAKPEARYSELAEKVKLMTSDEFARHLESTPMQDEPYKPMTAEDDARLTDSLRSFLNMDEYGDIQKALTKAAPENPPDNLKWQKNAPGAPQGVPLPPLATPDTRNIEQMVPKIEDMEKTEAQKMSEFFDKIPKDFIESSKNRARVEIASLLKGLDVAAVDWDKLHEMSFLRQKGDNEEKMLAEEIYNDLNDDSQKFYDRTKNSLSDYEAYYNAFPLMTGRNFIPARDYMPLSRIKEMNIDEKGEPVDFFEAISRDYGFTKHRKDDIPFEYYDKDFFGVVAKHIEERRLFLDAVKLKGTMEDYFKGDGVRQAMLRDDETGAMLREKALMIEKIFHERGWKTSIFIPPMEDASKQILSPEIVKEIAAGTDLGKDWLRRIAEYNKILGDVGLKLQVPVDIEAYKYMKQMDDTMVSREPRDADYRPGLKDEAFEWTRKAVGSTVVEPSQAFQRMDNKQIAIEGYGGNAKMHHWVKGKIRDANFALRGSHDRIVELAKKHGLDVRAPGFDKVIDDIFNNVRPNILLTRKAIDIARDEFADTASSLINGIEFAKEIANDLKEMSNYVKQNTATRPEAEFTKAFDPYGDRKPVLEKYLELARVYHREKELGEAMRVGGILAERLDRAGHYEKAHYWRKYLSEGVRGSMGVLDRALQVDKWAFKVTLPWRKKVAVDKFRSAMRRQGMSRVEIDSLLEKMEGEGWVDKNKGIVKVPNQKEFRAASWMLGLQAARVRSRIANNPGWTLRTQWLSYQITGARDGLYNSWVRAPYELVFSKDARDEARAGTMYQLKRGESGKSMPTEGEEWTQKLVLKEGIADKLSQKAGWIGTAAEATLDAMTAAAASLKADKLGMTGIDKEIFIDNEISRTQSVYDRSERAPILNSVLFKTLFSHKAYASTLLNNILEYGGMQKMDVKDRVAFFARMAVQLTAMSTTATVANYLKRTAEEEYEEALYAFIENIMSRNGTTLTEQFVNFGAGADLFDVMILPRGYMEEAATGYSYTMDHPTTWSPVSVPGAAMARAMYRFVDTGNIDGVQQELFNYLGFLGIPGGGFTGRVVAATIGQVQGEVQKGKMQVEFGDNPGDFINAALWGTSAAPSVMAEFEKSKGKPLTLREFLTTKYEPKGKKRPAGQAAMDAFMRKQATKKK